MVRTPVGRARIQYTIRCENRGGARPRQRLCKPAAPSTVYLRLLLRLPLTSSDQRYWPALLVPAVSRTAAYSMVGIELDSRQSNMSSTKNRSTSR